MPDYERPAVENERRLETASCRDPPANNYGVQMLERFLPPQQQQQSGGRRRTGGIISRESYKGKPVEIRVPKWTDCQKIWINSKDFETAQYIADAAYYLTGQPSFHFPDVKFDYLPLRLSTGEELTTREECSVYVAKIAKGSALHGQRKDFRDRAQKLILEMVKAPEVVRFLSTMRASPRQARQPRPEANPEDTDSPFSGDVNGMAMEASTPSEEATQALASTVTVNPSQNGSLVPVAEDTHSVTADDGEEENGTPMEVDRLSEEAIQALARTGTEDPAAVSQFDSTMSSYDRHVDLSTAIFASFEMDLQYESENCLTSASQSLGIWYPRSGEKEKEDLILDNSKEFQAFPDEGYADEEEFWKSFEPLDVEL